MPRGPRLRRAVGGPHARSPTAFAPFTSSADGVPVGLRALLGVFLLAAVLAVVAALANPDGGQARGAPSGEPQPEHHLRIEQRRAHVPAARAARAGRLRFGIYPGGGAGLVHATGTARPEDPVLRLAALRRLRGDRALVLHVYSSWSGDVDPREAVARALAEVRHYAAAGFAVEPVIRYRPAGGGGPSDVARFATHVRAVSRELARHRTVVSVQITNEANVPGAPDAADGAYAAVRPALVRGVVAAHDQLRAAGRTDVRVGFNWAASGSVGPDVAFWRDLRRLGGRRFLAAVDWVGVDLYPGTWSAGGDDPAAVRDELERVLRYLRRTALPATGLSRDVDLHISENGFPTGAGRDEAQQAILLRTAIETIHALRSVHGVTDYRWFDLRDSISGRPEPEHGYGVLRDDYTEKQGFGVLADLVRRLGR